MGGRWPPGFRFSPTDEELVLYYLKRKICGRRLQSPILIADVDVYKSHPWDLPQKSLLQTGDKQWYFFSSRDRKYPNGSRSSRTTTDGYWKATGKDRTICHHSKPVGNKKTLVYYHGRAPKGLRTDWVMHEYTLDDKAPITTTTTCNTLQDSYALYKVFRKSGPGPKNAEQYGAPFNEEEWDEDDAGVRDAFFQQQQQQLDAPPSVSTSSALSTRTSNTLPVGDLEDLLLQISKEQETVGQQLDFSTYDSQVHQSDVGVVVGSHDASCTCVDVPSIGQESIDFDLRTESSNQLAESNITTILASEDPGLTGVASCHNQGADEEFLEIKDFFDLESVEQSMDHIKTQDLIPDTDGTFDTFEYSDAPMFLAEPFELGGAVAAENHYVGFDASGIQNNQLYYTSELWTHEQAFNVSSPLEQSNVVMPLHASGALNACNTTEEEMTQGQQTHGSSSSESWISSTLLALLDSVPSSPAMASENTLISKTLERVSSFRTQEIVREETSTATSGAIIVAGRRGRKNGGLIFISLLVALCAVLWAMTTSVSVMQFFKGLWSQSVSSST